MDNQKYAIVNKQGRRLTGFYPSGGFEMRDLFAFSTTSWFVFNSEKAVQDELLRIIKECKEQQDRWGDWTDKAVKFAKSLSYQVIN